MTDDNHDDQGPEDPFTIGNIIAQPPERQPWYRRTWVLVAAAVAVVVIASVAVDLPSHTTVATDTADQTSIMKEVNTDVAPCSYAVKETFMIYRAIQKGTLNSTQKAQAPSLMRDDQNACSFISSSIFDLSNVEGTGTPAGKDIGNVVSVATLWTTSDALGAIEAVQTLSTDPGNTNAIASLAKHEADLAKDRAQAFSYVDAADRILHSHLPKPDLADVSNVTPAD